MLQSIRRFQASGASVLGVASVCLGLACGCVSKMTGSLTPSGFAHGTYPYKIDNKPGQSSLLGENWILDSAYTSKQGLRPKETDDYKTTLSFDLDGDGVFETQRSALIYDLRFVHRVSSGVIWLRTVPISNTLRDKELRVLMQEYVDGVAGAGYEVVNVGVTREIVEKRYAADILHRGPGTVGGQTAFAASFGVANIDQVQVNKDARRTRVMVVIGRPGFDYKIDARKPTDPAHQFPVIFVAGYSSIPEDFDRGLSDFQSLLQRVRFGEQTGYRVEWEDNSGAPPASAAAESAPASAPRVAESVQSGVMSGEAAPTTP